MKSLRAVLTEILPCLRLAVSVDGSSASSYRPVKGLLWFVLPGIILCGASSVTAQVVPLSLNETARQADAVVLGTITAKQSRWGDSSQRWMVTDYTLTVENVIYASETGEPISTTVTLTYWGGTIGSDTQAVADVRLPVVGERLLLLLRPNWAREISFTPVVGFNQGLFSVTPDVPGRGALVREAFGEPLDLTASGNVVRRSDGLADAPAVSLDTFINWLRVNINSIKAAPSERSPDVDRNDPRVLKTFAKAPSLSTSNEDASSISSRGPIEALSGQSSAGVPPVPSGSTTPVFGSSTAAYSNEPLPPYVTSGKTANLPIVVNNFPASFAPWSPEDQYQMSKWNYYASDIFRVFTNPTGTYSWPDGVFDLSGWPSSASLQSVYGSGWDSNTIGVTFLRYSGSTIVEADIALNPAFGFTLDDEWILNGAGSVQGFRQVMSHELGHMHGLDHQFNYLALMNYFPSVYRFFGMPYMDDAEGIRVEYPSRTVSHTDLAVYLYYETGYQSVTDATYPASVAAGGNLTFNNYHVENVGTTTISTPTIEWYLTAARNYNSSYYYLGQATYASLPRFTYFTPSSVQVTFPVPANVPPGSYYLGAFIRNDSGAFQSGFPFSNDFAFSRTRIQVTASSNCAVAQMTSPTNGSNIQPTTTFTWNTGSGNDQYWISLGTTGVSSTNLLNESEGTNTSKTISGLPSGTIYLRLWSHCAATNLWGSLDYTYTGSSLVSGTWTPLAATPPVAVTNCLLLTDGRVMCQRAFSNQWYALTPNSSGSYVNGTWSQLASMPSGYSPLYFASAVLPDGRVIVEGGEYDCSSGTCVANWQSKGAIYSPTTNSWTAVSPPSGWTSIGDASGVVLADGTFFLSDSLSKKTAKFNSSTLTWTAFGSGFQATTNDESGWTLLPDNTLLTVDATPANSLLSERFNPTTGVWSSAGNTPVSLADNDSARGSSASFEIGPGVLRPNGTVVFIGANPNIGTACCSGSAHTAIFNTATNTWLAGPNIPNSDGANDAPAAVLPNGNVLMQVAPPANSTNVFGTPSRFYEFDGSSISQVNSPANANYASYTGGMLVLPTGQILFTHQAADVYIYAPVGAANSAWAPTITSLPSTLSRGGTYTISGTQLNGLTQGAFYGDDLQAATNYPLIRITNNATGHVFYARTHDHSSMGVATGSTLVSTSFDIPAGTELGASTLVVVANGIPSSPMNVNVTSLNYTVTVSASPVAGGTVNGGGTFAANSSVTVTATANAGYTFVNWTENGGVVSSSSSYNFTLNGNRTLVANFSLGTKAQITSPVNNSTFTSGTVTFNWSPSTGATSYYLYVGNSLHTADIYANFVSGGTTTVSGIPTDGRTIFVTMWSLINGGWQSIDYTYRACPCGGITPAQITSPANTATFASGTVTFNWSPSTGASGYYLYVGNSLHTADIYANFVSGGVTTVSGIPTDGRMIFVTMWSLINGGWQSIDYTYRACPCGGVTPAQITSPANNSTFSSSTVTFNWSPSTGASSYYLYVGNSFHAADIYANFVSGGATTVSGIPTDGRTIYVTMWSQINGVWQLIDYTYRACPCGGVTPAQIISPSNTATFASGTVTFNWSPSTGASGYYLYVGNSLRTADIYANFVSGGVTTVSGIPTDGRMIFVTMWSLINGVWQPIDYTYRACPCGGVTPAQITSPANNSTFSSSTVTFNWSPSTGASNYYLYVGNSFHAADIYANFVSGGTTTVSKIPTDGRTIYVTMWSQINGVWQPIDYTFHARSGTPSSDVGASSINSELWSFLSPRPIG